ncbi:hypothetical protein AB205_0040560 [Aquarana catesbeiana]|uniref:Uncharacterized protein n=1 Tax=Aquarana catesbeiana TaxID=8400 RepID=A0A2G9QHB0_AQUCT|nr:hypothetical protein AB205_0040560 [Aquarana catesbeiana]
MGNREINADTSHASDLTLSSLHSDSPRENIHLPRIPSSWMMLMRRSLLRKKGLTL